MLHVAPHIVFVQYDEWSAHDRQLIGYIKTRAKPHLYYLPAEHNPCTQKLLAETTAKMEGETPISREIRLILYLLCFRQDQEETGRDRDTVG